MMNRGTPLEVITNPRKGDREGIIPPRMMAFTLGEVFFPGGTMSKKGNRAKRGTRGGRCLRSKKKAGVVDSGIFNLSKATLSAEEVNVLNHGLKFAPPHTLNKFNTFIDIQKYIRKLHIKRYLITNQSRLNINNANKHRHLFWFLGI